MSKINGPRVSNGQQGHFEPIQRGFINPFRPEDFIVRITANRRRWIHGLFKQISSLIEIFLVFPVDRLGRAKLAHHYVIGSSITSVLQTIEPVNFLSVVCKISIIWRSHRKHKQLHRRRMHLQLGVPHHRKVYWGTHTLKIKSLDLEQKGKRWSGRGVQLEKKSGILIWRF